MAAFFNTQLDFILFFYGLAFFLLGATCFAITRGAQRREPWAVLGLFALVHGLGEWLDLTALVISDTPMFGAARIAVMTGSFVLLMEFARQEAIRFGLKAPGQWLYIPLILFVALGGLTGGPSSAAAIARYTIGLVGAMATSVVFAQYARESLVAARRFAIFTAVGFALYGVSAGAIVPAAPFWPASVFNYDWFANFTEMPIQLVRGVLACSIAFSIWAIWGHQLASEVSSTRYTAYLHQQFIWTLVAMATILVLGWTLTEFLGAVYKQNVQEEARSDIDLLASRLDGETAIIDGMVKALAGSPSMLPLLVGGSRPDNEGAKSVLDLDVEASGAKLGYILDRSGTVVASSNRQEMAGSGTPYFRVAPYFQKAIAGEPGYHFAFDPMNGTREYYASYPVRVRNGMIVGVAVLKKSLDVFESDLKQFDRPYFLIDPNGIVVMTNRPQMLLRTMWPLSAEKKSVLTRQFGTLNDRPMLNGEITEAIWTDVDGKRDYVRRRPSVHGQWSLVILKPAQEIFASRAFGIVFTLLVTIMTLIYFFSKERRVHDNVEMERRLKLQELARDLRLQATTDPLTGLNNRLKFDQVLANEMLRSQRYKTPFSLILYDVDHFKEVNDTHGHQVGDKVLIQLSRFIADRIRSTDFLARWGGEEFVIVVPESDSRAACQFADKLRDAIAQLVFDQVGTVTCSFGVAQYEDGEVAEAFISRADDALYRAKINGRNRVEVASQSAVTRPDRSSAA
jgi:diguanylate cyclase (GGDEF)-like protein